MDSFTQQNPAATNAAISALASANKELTSMIEEMKRELNSSLAQWDDNARGAYASVQAQWDASAAKQQQIVAGMGTLLTQINDGYVSTELGTRQMWS